MLYPCSSCWALASPANAEDKKVSIRFLGGAKKVPLEGLKVTIRAYTGNATDDEKAKPLTEGKTDKEGNVGYTLTEGYYYVQIRLGQGTAVPVHACGRQEQR